MKKNRLLAGVTPIDKQRIPTSASEKPLVIYVSSDSLRMIKRYSERRAGPNEPHMVGNVRFVEETEKSKSSYQPAAGTDLKEVPAWSSRFVIRRRYWR
jgi:hypothetical protein